MSFNRVLSFPSNGQRHTSSSRKASPLHQSFPAYSLPDSTPGSAPHSPAHDFMATSHRSRSIERKTHDRNESRSSSVPSGLPIPRDPSRMVSPYFRDSRRSVKHLTCFWWKEKGSCRFSEEDCLYAHHDTGHYTDPPRQVIPGEPAKAGRSLDRALKNLGYSITTKASGPQSTPASSRPVTPGMEMKSASGAVSPSTVNQLSRRLEDENTFLRNLTEHFNHEKNVLLGTIELLQRDKKDLTLTIEGLTADKEHIARERDVLRQVVGQLQTQRSTFDVFGPPSSRSSYTTSSGLQSVGLSSNPYATTQQRAFGGIQEEEKSDPKTIFRHQGPAF